MVVSSLPCLVKHSNEREQAAGTLYEVKNSPSRSNTILIQYWQPLKYRIEASWNMIAHVQNPDFVFWRNGRVHLNQRGHQFSRLPVAEVCITAVLMPDTPCCEVAWSVLATHSIHQFPLHFPSRMSACAITFQLESNNGHCMPHRNTLFLHLPLGMALRRTVFGIFNCH